MPHTVDFLFRAKRDTVAARRYFEKSIAQNGSPETVTIDRSGANRAGLHAINAERETPIKVRQTKCLNNIIARSSASYVQCRDSRTFTALG
jgi:putative transposase